MENRIKKEFLGIYVPDMKTKIMTKIQQGKNTESVRKIKPTILIAAIVFCLLAIGAAAGGIRSMVKLNRGGKYLIVSDEGIAVNPTGFHFEEADVNFSEKAIENISGYIFTPPEPANFFETETLIEMEEFLDMKLHIPSAIAENALLYRMWASGAEGEARAVYVQIVPKNEDMGSMDVYLRDSPGVIGTASEPVIYRVDTTQGMSVSTAVAESRKGGMAAHAIYEIDGAMYGLVVKGKNTNEVLEKAEMILNTIEG